MIDSIFKFFIFNASSALVCVVHDFLTLSAWIDWKIVFIFMAFMFLIFTSIGGGDPLGK